MKSSTKGFVFGIVVGIIASHIMMNNTSSVKKTPAG